MKMNQVGVMLKEQENQLQYQKNKNHLILLNLINLNHQIKISKSENKIVKIRITKIIMSFNFKIMKTLETLELKINNRN